MTIGGITQQFLSLLFLLRMAKKRSARNSRALVSGNFHGLASEIFQIEKEAPVLQHSFPEQLS